MLREHSKPGLTPRSPLRAMGRDTSERIRLPGAATSAQSTQQKKKRTRGVRSVSAFPACSVFYLLDTVSHRCRTDRNFIDKYTQEMGRVSNRPCAEGTGPNVLLSILAGAVSGWNSSDLPDTCHLAREIKSGVLQAALLGTMWSTFSRPRLDLQRRGDSHDLCIDKGGGPGTARRRLLLSLLRISANGHYYQHLFQLICLKLP